MGFTWRINYRSIDKRSFFDFQNAELRELSIECIEEFTPELELCLVRFENDKLCCDQEQVRLNRDL